MTEELSLDNKILAYLFDPDEGLKQDVEQELSDMNYRLTHLKDLQDSLMRVHAYKDAWQENFKRRAAAIEVTAAQIEFYTDVWNKILRATTPLAIIVGPSEAATTVLVTLTDHIPTGSNHADLQSGLLAD